MWPIHTNQCRLYSVATLDKSGQGSTAEKRLRWLLSTARKSSVTIISAARRPWWQLNMFMKFTSIDQPSRCNPDILIDLARFGMGGYRWERVGTTKCCMIVRVGGSKEVYWHTAWERENSAIEKAVTIFFTCADGCIFCAFKNVN